jgi:cation-transporting P-type ATPase I
MGVAKGLRALFGDVLHRRRRVWRAGRRAHVELRAEGGVEVVGQAAEAALRRLDSVEWVAFDPVTPGVLVELAGGDDVGPVLEVVEQVERAHDTEKRASARSRMGLPDDPVRLSRESLALMADGVALGCALTGRLARVARLPVEFASVFSVVDSQPRLRRTVESIVGPGATDVALLLGNAVGQGLAQGPLGLIVDGVTRASRVAEDRARQQAWRLRESTVATASVRVCREPRPERTVPLQQGPVERYADQAGVASIGTLTLLLPTTRDLRRATATALAPTPKAAQQGREVFAAHLGRLLAARGLICFDPKTLRRLDRVDCVAIDGHVLVADERSVDEVITVADAEPREVERRAGQLLSIPRAASARRVWSLRPLGESPSEKYGHDMRDALARLGEGEGEREVLAVVHRDALAGIVTVERQLRRGAAHLVQAARSAGHLVAIAGEPWIGRRFGADVVLESTSVDGVRALQSDGHGVALISATDPDALQVADCGIGLALDGIPWAADLVGWDLEAARLGIEAAGVAYEVSRQSVAISLGGASVGSVLAFAGPARGAARRAMTAVNVAALFAQVNAVRAVIALGRRPVPLHDDQPPWHELDADDVFSRLDTSPEGLSESEADRRRAPTEDSDTPSLPRAMATELANPLTPVLAGAAAVSGVVGSVTDAVLVGSVMAINGLLGGTQRFRVERAVRSLGDRNTQPLAVRRGGTLHLVPPEAVVPGDVLHLDAGEAVPADARIVSANGLEVDESAVTGESLPVAKDAAPIVSVAVAERTSMLWAGTTIAAGSVDAAVVAIGAATLAGRALTESAAAEPSTTGVESRLRDLTRLTLPISLLGGAAVTALGLLRRVPLQHTLQTGVSLAVAAVPEGLPILATMAQLASARRLAGSGALVRNPRAIEALGRVDVLCADKTGTLTEGRLTLRLVSDGERDWKLDQLDAHGRRVIAVGLRASPSNGDGEEPLPHLTDQAVVEGAMRIGLEASGDADHWTPFAELPFEPTRSYHAVLGENGRGSVLAVKGAPEVVLPRCTSWWHADVDTPLDTNQRQTLLSRVEALGLRGYRVLAVAEREASTRQDLDDERVDRLRLLGFLALSDQLRSTAAAAASAMQRAGVDVVILTGDHPSTAEGIGAELGILDGGRVLTGQQIDEFNDDELMEALDDVAVFARVTPAHKVRLVNAYRQAGRTVAMTGDGANDAPAIKLADTGIALGENSTSAARHAADVVVPDGRIETVVDTLIEGRAMWSSVRDAIAILLGGNLGEIGFTLAGAAITGRSPLNARQLLLVNLLTDALPATAIALRPPHHNSDGLLRAGPDVALGRSLDRSILLRAAATAGGAGTAWLGARLTGRRRRASTVALAALVGTQLGQTLISGARDPLVLAASLGSAAALFAIVQTPGVSHFFGCTPLGPIGWSIATASSTTATAASAVTPKLVRALR